MLELFTQFLMRPVSFVNSSLCDVANFSETKGDQVAGGKASKKQGQARNPKANCRQAHCNFIMCVYTCVALERSGAICNDLERSGATWSDPVRSGAIWGNLE